MIISVSLLRLYFGKNVKDSEIISYIKKENYG